MKKRSIITKGLIASGMLYANVNAANILEEKVFEKSSIESISKNKKAFGNDGFTQIYQWRIETESGIFEGSCKSIDEVNREIMQCTDRKIITKSITPIYLAEKEVGGKVYMWSVVTKKGHASGQSTTLEEAKNMVNLFGSKNLVKSNIIESETTLK